MDYEEARRRLKNHANLPNAGPDNESLVLALWHVSRNEPGPECVPLFDDVIECLECVNIALNGEVPSESPSERIHQTIDTGLCYSMGCIIESLLKFVRSSVDPTQREEMLSMARNLALAWNCVLAGDIDDISQEIEWSR